MDKEEMPRVDFKKDTKKVTLLEKNFMKLVEEKNLARARTLQRKNTRSIKAGLSLGATVIGIYLFTIYKVKQENFLDDFEMPETTVD